MRKLYVSNLSFLTERDELERLFAGHGTVRSVNLLEQPAAGNGGAPEAVVEMHSERDGFAVIAALNGLPHRGFALVVGWASLGEAKRVVEEPSVVIDLMGAPPRGGFGRPRESPWPARASTFTPRQGRDAEPRSALGAKATKGVARANH